MFHFADYVTPLYLCPAATTVKHFFDNRADGSFQRQCFEVVIYMRV